MELAEERELLRLRLLFGLFLDSLETDRDRLRDFLDNERLLDLLDKDLLLLFDFFGAGDTDFFNLCGDLETERFVRDVDRTTEDWLLGDLDGRLSLERDLEYDLVCDLEYDLFLGEILRALKGDRDGDLDADIFLETERAGDLVVDREIDMFFGETSLDFSEFREGDLETDFRFEADLICSGDLAFGEILFACLGDFEIDLFRGLSIDTELELDLEPPSLDADLERLILAIFSKDLHLDFDRDLDLDGERGTAIFFVKLLDLDLADIWRKLIINSGGDSVGDLSLVVASALVKGKAGEGDLLVVGDTMVVIFSGDAELDLSCVGPIILCPGLGSSSGNAMSKTFSPFFSILTLTGLITFLPKVSLAFAAKPVCSCFKVFNSFCLSSSSCFGSSSAISPSSSLEDRRLTLGAMV